MKRGRGYVISAGAVRGVGAAAGVVDYAGVVRRRVVGAAGGVSREALRRAMR